MIFRRLRHRGPDWSGIHCHEDCYLAHQRLAIIDPTSGDQPLYNEDKTVVVTVCNQKWNQISILYFFMPIGVYFSILTYDMSVCSAFGDSYFFSDECSAFGN
jgi:hypothetical protein